jgi:NADPH:quinone reductase-like Zn-dependent oxidoreductase
VQNFRGNAQAFQFSPKESLVHEMFYNHRGAAAAQARLTVPISGVFSLEQAAKAHETLEQGHVLGRIVLKIR